MIFYAAGLYFKYKLEVILTRIFVDHDVPLVQSVQQVAKTTQGGSDEGDNNSTDSEVIIAIEPKDVTKPTEATQLPDRDAMIVNSKFAVFAVAIISPVVEEIPFRVIPFYLELPTNYTVFVAGLVHSFNYIIYKRQLDQTRAIITTITNVVITAHQGLSIWLVMSYCNSCWPAIPTQLLGLPHVVSS